METIDSQTGEVIETALAVIPETMPDIFTNIAVRPVSDEQTAILLAEVNPDDLEILPTGEVYLTQAKYRQRLNQAFHPGAWAIRPISKPYIKDNLAMQEWALYANGQFMAYAVGGAEYSESNQRMNWSDVLETVKSNALMRLCKDLGIASDCWNKRFTEKFKAEYCVKVWIEGKNKPQWRRLDSDPFLKELKPTDDSPNRDKYGQVVKVESKSGAKSVDNPPEQSAETNGKRTFKTQREGYLFKITDLLTECESLGHKQEVEPNFLKTASDTELIEFGQELKQKVAELKVAAASLARRVDLSPPRPRRGINERK